MGRREGAIRVGSLQIRLHRGYDAQQPGFLTRAPGRNPQLTQDRDGAGRRLGTAAVPRRSREQATEVLVRRPDRPRARGRSRPAGRAAPTPRPSRARRARRPDPSIDGRSRLPSRRRRSAPDRRSAGGSTSTRCWQLRPASGAAGQRLPVGDEQGPVEVGADAPELSRRTTEADARRARSRRRTRPGAPEPSAGRRPPSTTMTRSPLESSSAIRAIPEPRRASRTCRSHPCAGCPASTAMRGTAGSRLELGGEAAPPLLRPASWSPLSQTCPSPSAPSPARGRTHRRARPAARRPRSSG